MENKQTAVDYLFSFFMQTNYDSYINYKAYKIAKKMEKEQIINAAYHGVDYEHSSFDDAEQYYNETYNN